MSSLLIFNYSMNEGHPVFSHQLGIVRKLASRFERIIVITNESKEPITPLPKNVVILINDWRLKKNFRNAWSFIKLFLVALHRYRPNVLFSHMTEVQSAIVGPFCRLIRLRHLLWYAHKSQSKYLVWNSFWVNRVLTSTEGSCPISGKKVRVIGQAIDEDIFTYNHSRHYSHPTRWLHFGRVDPSKRIDLIIRLYESAFRDDNSLELEIIGNPTSGNEGYLNNLKIMVKQLELSKVTFRESLRRDDLPSLLNTKDLFVHAFQGSLDKTLVEASLNGISIISCNLEYRRGFYCWTDKLNFESDYKLLQEELANFYRSTEILRKRKSLANSLIARKSHSLDLWIDRLTKELTEYAN